MKRIRPRWLPVLFCVFTACAVSGQESGQTTGTNCLWYDRPAERWEEALPVGNGRVGAMVFGGVGRERLQLNEGTLWAGGPYNPVNPEAHAALPEARRLVSEGRYKEAADLIEARIMARPLHQMPYQTVGDLILVFPEAAEVSDYRRSLDLDTATVTTSYRQQGIRHLREVFASHPDQAIVVRLSADRPGSITFKASMQTQMDAGVSTRGVDGLVMCGRGGDAEGIKGALRYEARVAIRQKGGRISAGDGALVVTGADEVIVYIAAATSYRRFDDVSGDPGSTNTETLARVQAKPYGQVWSDHLADYGKLFRRVSLDLGATDAMKLPTDQRIARFAEGADPQLAALYYHYARYLLISCSRPGGQPANLQGLWNDSLTPPWGSKYTININTQMNYWPAESGNLAECTRPLITMIRELAETGARTARGQYGAGGWVAHHNTDLWRATAPIDGPFWGMWPAGGAWLCLHLWDRYEFGGDRAELADFYPLMRGAAEFFLETLQTDPKHGWLVTNPSISPENGHLHGTSVCAGPTMDMQILRDLFANTIKAAEILGLDESFRKRLRDARARLAPNQIGSAGQLQEWMEDWDLQAEDMQHRHVSHLYGLYPGRDISRRGTPELAAAVRKSLELRGDRATGWATAWRICLWAHLGEGDRAHEILGYLLSPERTYPNMFDAHPPFQIDGNFGGAAGIAEMLVQSRPGEIELLPALPRAWPEGSVKGLCARGGFEIDLVWSGGRLQHCLVRSGRGSKLLLVYGSSTLEREFSPGEVFSWDGR